MIYCDSLCCTFLGFNQTYSASSWSRSKSPLKSSLEFLGSISPSETSLKLSREFPESSESLLKLFKLSSPTFKTDFCRSSWLFNIFRRPSLNPSCISRLGFVNLHFFLHIPIAPIWLLSGLVAYFSALALACPSFPRGR